MGGGTYGPRASDGSIRLAILGQFRKGGSPQRIGGAWIGARCSSSDEVRPRAQRERLHAVLPRAQDRRVMQIWVSAAFEQGVGTNGLHRERIHSSRSFLLK